MPFDPTGFVPDFIKERLLSSLVDFLVDQAESVSDGPIVDALTMLRSDADFRQSFHQALQRAERRFVDQCAEMDRELLVALMRQRDQFWQAKPVQETLREMVRRPGTYLEPEKQSLEQALQDILPQFSAERIRRVAALFLHLLAEEVMVIPPLQPVYGVQLQKLSLDQGRAMIAALQNLQADQRRAMMALLDVVSHPNQLAEASTLSLPEPPKIQHNLPNPDYVQFVGREKELTLVYELLCPSSRAWVVTIDGIGGIGKSALALEVAHRYLREYDHLPPEERFQAIIWTSAKASVLTADGIAPRLQVTRTLDDIYTTIADTLKRESITRAQPGEQGGLVTTALTRQRTLLIVDNLETIDDERVNAFLRELPAPTKAIVTTRHRLDVAYPVRVAGMSKEDGLELIDQECAKKQVTLTESQAERLFARTGGVPLAIVWSVAQMGYGYGVATVLQRLGQPNGDIGRFCFEGAMELVRGTDSHSLIMALCYFAISIGASRDALGHVANLPELDRDDGLVRLERLSLVSRKDGRFHMLPLTREYVSYDLYKNPEFEKQAQSGWITWLVDYACRYGGEDWDWRGYNALDIEIENILSMIDQGLEEEWPESLVAFRSIIYYMKISGRWAESILLDRRALRLAQKVNDIRTICLVSSQSLGWVLGQLGLFSEAERYAMLGLQAARSLNDPHDLVHSTRILGQIRRKQGRLEDALQLYQSALDMARLHHYKGFEGNLLGELAKTMRDMGERNKAWDLFEQATSILELRERDKPLYASLLGHMGRMAYEDGNLVDGRAYCEACRDIFDEISGVTDVLLTLAEISSAEGRLVEAKALAQQSVDLYNRLGMKDELLKAEELVRMLSQ